MAAIIGVDVGGTFTDLFLFDTTTREFRVAKVPSNRGDEAAGFLNGLQQIGDVAAFSAIVRSSLPDRCAEPERCGMHE